MTDSPVQQHAAAALPAGDAAAASSWASRRLLDAAVARAIATLAHDLRNALGIVSMQVEAIAVRSAAAAPDLRAILSHANVASEHIERLAGMTNALIAFARGRSSSDLGVIAAEAAALVPLRPVTVSGTEAVAVGLDAVLARAVILEVLVLALDSPTVPQLRVSAAGTESILTVVSGYRLEPDAALEWVVQFQALGGRITPTGDGLSLVFPPSS